MGIRSLLAVVFLLPAPVPGDAGPPPRLSSYELSESLDAVTPAGVRHRSLAGSVRVLAGVGRWDVTRGSFPRGTATAVLGSADGLTLVDRERKLSAPATADALRALFRSPRGDGGLVAVRAGDIEVEVSKAKPGEPFEGRPVARRRLRFAYTLATTLPGSIQRTSVTGIGNIDTIDEPAATWPPIDDLGRLFDVPPEVDEKLAEALAGVAGLPVAVTVETRTETTAEAVGALPPEGLPRPPVTTTKVVRRLSGLSVRRASDEDRSLFEVPADVRGVGLERLVPAAEGPR